MFVIALDLVEPGSHESAQLLVPSSYGRFAASGTVDVSMGMLDEAISIAQRQGDHAVGVQALAMKANILGWALEFPRSMQSAEQALANLEEEKDPIAEVKPGYSSRTAISSPVTRIGPRMRSGCSSPRQRRSACRAISREPSIRP